MGDSELPAAVETEPQAGCPVEVAFGTHADTVSFSIDEETTRGNTEVEMENREHMEVASTSGPDRLPSGGFWTAISARVASTSKPAPAST